MTIDDIAARHAKAKADKWPVNANETLLLAEITRLTAALADAEARGRRAGLEEAAQWHDEQADFTKYHGLSVAAEQHKNCGIAIRALAQSPEDGKQEKV